MFMNSVNIDLNYYLHSNIWLIRDEDFDEFVIASGGKVIYIAEEPHPRYSTHPAMVTGGALLPPIEAIHAEIDGNIVEAVYLYEQYLMGPEADPFISVIIAAALNDIPIGILFGRDEMNMEFPKVFIDFLYKMYGLIIGIDDKNLAPAILIEAVPTILAKLYNMNIIDYRTFMERHPMMPILADVIPKMAYEVNPVVEKRDYQHYYDYFEMVKSKVFQNNHRFLIDPLEGL